MRVMIDTNVLLSALLFPGQRMNALIDKIITGHQLVLSSYIVDELMNVTRRKFKGKEEAVDLLLSQLPYELVYTPKQPKPGLFIIRDEKDYPVLYSAITEGVDVFITGDRDFDGLGLEKPEIISPAGFFEKY
ncbi:putative toxin-antitoxin system toxin component, PIN family [Acetanaerobacterium elongatum]|uniref:Putative toxin-antitoxin system toxin component, PIN family n=1 Tax=Acetanaerobacterium elongatum TaxID=258515 RepID=A0A1G9YWA1_9FIRM|nr:putative toxin-antitoxin system toxin component, PIN family [Acetanaerobacterium elongatum]SDN13394.1 putative toxin-antitoxin system toxin component, PIN family [Acetanaerobacterium elongatum]